MFKKTFSFGRKTEDKIENIPVSAEDLYTLEKGYGFVTEANRSVQELLQYPELNSGFDVYYWYQDQILTRVEQDEAGCYVDSEKILAALAEKEGGEYPGEPRMIPLSFKLDVPEQGNYLVELTLKVPEISQPGAVSDALLMECGEASMPKAEEFLVFTGRRRLAWKGSIPAGEARTLKLAVNVCDIIPRGQEAVFEDKTLDITVVGKQPRITSIKVESAAVPTIYIAGDSTVTDQSASYPYSPGTSYCGWGQMLSAYLDPRVAVSNHAHSGLTTASFREEGHYGIVEKYWKPGDYLFIQFAHNDQKLDSLKAEEGYRENMITYIKEARAAGIHPVIVTPVARNTWKGNDGSYNDLLAAYGESCIRIGRELQVPVLDLHRLSMAFVKEKGLEAAKPYFFPNDYTHSDDYGAYRMAGFVAGEIRKNCREASLSDAYRFLWDCVTEGFGAWEPEAEIILPVKPAVYEEIKGPETAQLLSEVDRLEEAADRVAVLDMLIKTCRFFPTNVYNDMFRDIVGHEWYAGTVECAYQNGMIIPELAEDDCFYPDRAVTLEEFLVFAMNGYQSRKPLPMGENSYAGKCRDFASKYIAAASALGLIPADGSADLDAIITRQEAVDMCRRMHI